MKYSPGVFKYIHSMHSSDEYGTENRYHDEQY